MNNAKKIREAIQQIAQAKDGASPFFTATVKTIDADTCTVDVAGLKLSGVRLTSVTDASATKLLVVPKIGSTVLLADLSGGAMRSLVIIAWSEIESITINEGTNGGMVMVNALTDKLNALKDTVKDLVSKYNSHVHITTATVGASPTPGVLSATASSATVPVAFKASDYENTKIKH